MAFSLSHLLVTGKTKDLIQDLTLLRTLSSTSVVENELKINKLKRLFFTREKLILISFPPSVHIIFNTDDRSSLQMTAMFYMKEPKIFTNNEKIEVARKIIPMILRRTNTAL